MQTVSTGNNLHELSHPVAVFFFFFFLKNKKIFQNVVLTRCKYIEEKKL